MAPPTLVSLQKLEGTLLWVRDRWVMLDQDLAQVYGVSTTRLNEQVSRNRKRFPVRFAFRLTRAEFENLISQSARSSWGGRRKLPYVFTEAGAVMAANVLRSSIAVEMSVQVVEAFVRVSRAIAADREILRRIEQLEQQSRAHDAKFQVVVHAIRKLLNQPATRKTVRRIGFSKPPDDPFKASATSSSSPKGLWSRAKDR